MDSELGSAVRLGVVLVLLGGVGFAAGSVMAAQYDCVSGTELAIDRVAEPDTDNNTTAFAELSPVEQRLFLEAYTSSSGDRRYGERYANWSEGWFNGSSGPAYVEYSGEYWELSFFAADCGVSVGVFVRGGGALGALLGGLVLTLAGILRLRHGT